MFSEVQSLRQLFHRIVAECYDHFAGIRDAEMTSYIADLLTDFSVLDPQFRMRDENGLPIEDLNQMLIASDPVFGSAPSFIAERAIRKHIGDYALFHAGMCPEMFRSPEYDDGELYHEIVYAGRSSYYVVSQFNVFEYAAEAPLFERLAEDFELCVYGLNKVRGEFERLCIHAGIETSVLKSAVPVTLEEQPF